jgi:hypothetical protein
VTELKVYMILDSSPCQNGKESTHREHLVLVRIKEVKGETPLRSYSKEDY